MGLDTTHDAWHGAYSAFMRWREKLAEAAGLPPLRMMECFFVAGNAPYDPSTMVYDKTAKETVQRFLEGLPIKWECLKPDALHELLYHSDCEGDIPADRCAAIADSLERIMPNIPEGDGGGHIGNWKEKTQKFIDGLRKAAAANEPLEFH
jgi:hypothetical protein